MRKKKKGQAAVEFLTTYGWAIMATLIAVGALYYFDVLDPNNFTTVKCETGPQLQCLEAALYDNNSLDIRLRNNHNIEVWFKGTITIDSVLYPIPEQSLKSGETTDPAIRIDGSAIGFKAGETHDAEITIYFGRASGSTPYTLKGSATLKVVHGS